MLPFGLVTEHPLQVQVPRKEVCRTCAGCFYFYLRTYKECKTFVYLKIYTYISMFFAHFISHLSVDEQFAAEMILHQSSNDTSSGTPIIRHRHKVFLFLVKG